MDQNINTASLEAYGKRCAISICSDEKCSGRIVSRLTRRSYRSMHLAAKKIYEYKAPLEYEWISDNRYIAEKNAAFAADAFRCSGNLPAASNKKTPIIFEAAESLILAGELNEERIEKFLCGFQKVRSFSEKELSLFFPALSAALIKRLESVVKCIVGKGIGDNRVSHEENAEQLKSIFDSFRALDFIDASELILRSSAVEKLFMQDTIYAYMDETSRALYRRRLAAIAEKNKISEEKAARKIIEEANLADKRHIGEFFFQDKANKKKNRIKLALYMTGTAGAAFIISAALAYSAKNVALFFLLLIPLSEILKQAADRLSALLIKPDPLPRMELKNGIPEEYTTMAVISCIPRSALEAADLVRKAELYSLANRDSGKNLLFGLLMDLPESDEPDLPDDKEIVNAAKESVEALNSKYGERFFLFSRKRRYSRGTGKWCGRERKRGAVEALIKLIKGLKSELYPLSGDEKKLDRIKYLILLDSDTRLTIGSAKKLVGTIVHPLCRPLVDKEKRIVIRGHGIIAPAVSVDLDSSNASSFSLIAGGHCGTDRYSSVKSDLYQDLFDRGSFSGKGIVSVDAYADCLPGRFPLDTVLSHDLPEGELLRCGFASDIEFTDGFPSGPRPYLRRLHRWTRGDWQNIVFLSRRIKDDSGVKQENGFDGLSKWKIVDNLRRSLLAPLCLTSIIRAFFIDNFYFAGLIAFLSIVFPIVVCAFDSSIKAKKGKMYRSRQTSGLGLTIQNVLVSIILLPQTAAVELSAIVCSMYRLVVSRKGLLKWTVYANTETNRESAAQYLKFMLPSVLIGAILLFSNAPGPAFGLLWILSFLVAFSIGKKIPSKPRIKNKDRKLLYEYSEKIWLYFSDFLTPEIAFLPPDNFQEEPAIGIAERTSPTNIGLALLSVLSACELSLIDNDSACGLCAQIIASLEKLEKWRGHLFNWYDLKTLRPMRPRYVSTVDSGNLAACLTVSEVILRRFGAVELSDRIRNLCDDMDFRSLYDDKMRLFYIGADENGKPAGHYDLFASEARLTSYYACARGIVDPKHWQRLGRPMTRADWLMGVASWNGSVFEYFMPELLLPLYRNSLIWESLRFCLKAQKTASKPWGMSESAFASLDDSGSYRYKAHGVQSAALKRKVALDKVIAPYSSFLTLPLSPESAVRNIRELRKWDAEGKYGFYDAVDQTEKRLPKGEKYVAVKCFMAHHLGMSLVAAANALCDDVIVRSFMSDPEMAAFSELLQEKGPVGIRVNTTEKTIKDKTADIGADKWERSACGDDVRFASFSNGVYSMVVSSDGCSRSKCGETILTMFDGTIPNYHGAEMLVKHGGEVVPVTGGNAEHLSYSCILTKDKARFSVSCPEWSVKTDRYIPDKISGEIWEVVLTNTGSDDESFELGLYLEPILSGNAAYLSHPAFSKLSMQTRSFKNGVTALRRPGGNEPPYAMSVCSSLPFSYDTSREAVIGQFGSPASAINEKAKMTVGNVLDPCLFIRCSVDVPCGDGRIIVFAVTCGENADASEHSAVKILSSEGMNTSSFSDFALRESMMEKGDLDVCDRLLFSLIHPAPDVFIDRDERVGIGDLWRIGVSGDLPTAYVDVVEDKSLDKAKAFMRSGKYLRMMGFPCDLIFICSEPDGYSRPFSSALNDLAEKLGRPKGSYIIRGDNAGKIRFVCGKAGAGLYRVLKRDKALLQAGKRDFGFEDGKFIYETPESIGMPAWSHIMSNGSMGWLVADFGTFGLWRGNARENRIIRWINDPLSDSGAEKLCLLRGGEEISLFASRDKYGCRVEYGPGYAVWRRSIGSSKINVKGCVYYKKDVRILEIVSENLKDSDIFIWRTEPFPNEKEWGVRTVSRNYTDNSVEYIDHETGQKFVVKFSCPITARPDGSFSFRPDRRATICASFGESLDDPTECIDETVGYWSAICHKELVKTPYPRIDVYMNDWCLYQIIACRILGRASLYQSGGAIGFRDQLQDVISIADLFPDLARKQIIEAAEHQYIEGDVMHWWHRGMHEESDKGVRTKCSDDLVWLVWAACEFSIITGNDGIFDEKASWIVSQPLGADDVDRYENAVTTEEKSTIYEHCIRAIVLVQKRGVGSNGLLKIGGGDWNDGFNRLGSKGNGESVWLTFFAAKAARSLSEAAARLRRVSDSDELIKLAEEWGKAADEAWSNDRYLRGT